MHNELPGAPISGPVAVFVTFLLALIGYAGLTTMMVTVARGWWPVLVARATVAIIVAHVLLVWHVRYEWQFSEATRNGYVGFAIFHAALAAVVASLAVDFSVARRLVTGAFAAVTVGAVAATFRYEVVESFRIPVLIITTTGIAGLAHARLVASRSRRSTR